MLKIFIRYYLYYFIVEAQDDHSNSEDPFSELGEEESVTDLMEMLESLNDGEFIRKQNLSKQDAEDLRDT